MPAGRRSMNPKVRKSSAFIRPGRMRCRARNKKRGPPTKSTSFGKACSRSSVIQNWAAQRRTEWNRAANESAAPKPGAPRGGLSCPCGTIHLPESLFIGVAAPEFPSESFGQRFFVKRRRPSAAAPSYPSDWTLSAISSLPTTTMSSLSNSHSASPGLIPLSIRLYLLSKAVRHSFFQLMRPQ